MQSSKNDEMEVKQRNKRNPEKVPSNTEPKPQPVETKTGKQPIKENPKPLGTANRDILYKALIIISTMLAFIVRVWMIYHPDEVVFDEVHFGKFASFYLKNEYYFDVHPPLGKLLLALVGYCVGYEGDFLFEKIGLNYRDQSVPYVAFRIWCACCGVGVVPFAILIMKEVGVSVIAATLGASMLVFGS
jgi:dolichyl-phosphate-mannose-protein mannosyltransferase